MRIALRVGSGNIRAFRCGDCVVGAQPRRAAPIFDPRPARRFLRLPLGLVINRKPSARYGAGHHFHAQGELEHGLPRPDGRIDSLYYQPQAYMKETPTRTPAPPRPPARQGSGGSSQSVAAHGCPVTVTKAVSSWWGNSRVQPPGQGTSSFQAGSSA